MARSTKPFQWHVMINQSGESNDFGDAFGKQVDRMYQQSSNHIGQYLKIMMCDLMILLKTKSNNVCFILQQWGFPT